jgi:hypothetical protein
MRHTLLLLLLAFSLLLPSPASAQSPAPGIDAQNVQVAYLFGSQVTFQATLPLPAQTIQAHILFRAEGEAETRLAEIPLGADGETTFIYRFEQGNLRPFAKIRFWYRLTLADGSALQSQEFFFRYVDNRFPWQTLQEQNIFVHWYAGDVEFGQLALDAARRGLQNAQTLFPSLRADPIDLYIYASNADLQPALGASAQTWSGGHASPDLRTGLVAIAPSLEQRLDMERKIPHEIAHILHYDQSGANYPNQPTWLREGIASYVEVTPLPEYNSALLAAAQANAILPFTDLCASFPSDSGRAFLAYAQSESFTRYIVNTYGQSGLLALIHAYQDNLSCEQGATRALGKPLSQLQRDWQFSVLNQNPLLAALLNTFPYLAILSLTMLLPLGNALTFRRHAKR